VGFNWGSNQALSGSVSLSNAGLGSVRFSERDGVSYNINVLSVSYQGLSVGVGYSSESGWNGNAGYADTNGAGFSVSTSGGGELSLNASKSTGISFSSNGSHSVSLGGVGMTTSFNNTVKSGDYNTSTNSSNFSLPIPVPGVGVFSLSFGKQEFKYWMGKNVNNFVTGPINFNQPITDIYKPIWINAGHFIPHYLVHRVAKRCDWTTTDQSFCWYIGVGHGVNRNHIENIECTGQGNCNQIGTHSQYVDTSYWGTQLVGKAFMDINEVPLLNNDIAQSVDMSINNMTFPSYDNYNIQAQGLSGSMSSPLFENGALFGLSDRENNQGYALKYDVNGSSSTTTPINAKFDSKPFFYLDNEISTYLNMADVPTALFNITSTNTSSLSHYSSGVEVNAKPRRATSTFVEYYTNDEIRTNYNTLKQNGYLQANTSGFDRTGMPKEGIGAFKITATDGKTYHYSLPVYNHEIITRTFGAIPASQNEWESYFEKRQLEPFATHWLLTAVTGPDFIDNGDGVAGDGDLGYWTSFEYGKWTDAFIWKAPYKKDYIVDDKNPAIKTWIRGRKQLYYLDKIKTRTHTALFVKNERYDSPSENWSYHSARHINDLQDNSVEQRFNVPSQKQLMLSQIILVKNQNDSSDKTFGNDGNQSTTIHYNQSDKESENAKYNIYDNVLDTGDGVQTCIPKAIKVINFTYDYTLVPGDNRLTLKSVDFNGKTGSSVIPPYKFEYENSVSSFNIDNKDGWGYLYNKPEAFSLNKITTPQGGIINVNYESNKFISSVSQKLDFHSSNNGSFTANPNVNIASNPLTATISVGNNTVNQYPINVGQTVNISYNYGVASGSGYYNNFYNGPGHISAILGTGNYQVTFDGVITNAYTPVTGGSGYGGSASWKVLGVSLTLNSQPYNGGGCRVKNINVTDGSNSYFTDYEYGTNNDGVGYVSYVPYSQNIAKEVPYSAELPAPRVMYEYVTASSHGLGTVAEGKTRYKFNVIKQKTPGAVEYGDFYKINKVETPEFTNSSNKSVNITTFTVHDNLASVGQLLEMTTFNSKGQQLSKITNDHYKTTDVILNNMGKTQESYQSYKTVDYTNAATQDKWLINSSTRIKYPNLIKSSTEQKSGYTYSTNFNDYDLISGVSKEQVSFSSDGKSLKTTTVPAYLKYPDMGSKVTNINNKNMLSQTASSYSYIMDNGTWKETGVGITTWSNQWTYRDIQGNTATPTLANEKVWRKHKTYIWNGQKDANGIFTGYASATDDGFVWGVGLPQVTGTKWKQASEITLYDHYSAPLEMKDVNGNLASTKMGDNDSKIMTTGNAGYSELFYAGAENITGTTWLEPEVKIVNATRDLTNFHTGKYSIATTSSSQFGVNMKANEHRAGKYKLNVWVHKTNVAKARVNIGGVSMLFNGETVTAGDWVLKTHYFLATTAAINPYVYSLDGTTVYYDDLMIRPMASSISGYVYNEYDELSYIIGNNGLATKFEYDNAGRLIRTYVEVVDDIPNALTGGFKKKSENVIKYKNL